MLEKKVWKGKYMQNLQVEGVGRQIYISAISRLGVTGEVTKCGAIRSHVTGEV